MSVTEQLTATYQLVDEFPGVNTERLAERESAMRLLESRRGSGEKSTVSSELLPVDSLSTAYHVIAAEQTHGNGSVEHAERWDGLVLDCRRLVAEWYRKLRPEYFSPLRHKYDPATQSFFSHGLSIRQMTENALVPISDNSEEEARRVNERVEDATPQIMRSLGAVAVGAQVIRTVSECTDKALTEYTEDMRLGRNERSYGGYVPQIAKLMVRDIRLDVKTGDRLEEQLGLPGTYITHEIIQEALRRRGIEADHMDKTTLHGAQILAADGLVDFAALLDSVAGEEWCTNLFMGEEVPDGFVKDYEGFREEAHQRQKSLSDLSETVATFVLDLAQDGVDRRAALVLVEEFVKKALLEIGKQDTVAAEQMFGATTAEGLREVAQLEKAGRYDEANTLQQKVEKQAPGGGFCGAGSCGLEGVNTQSADGRALTKKLKADSSDLIVKDKVRSCKCGRRGIVYAYNKTKVNKYCQGCGAFESKVSIVKST